MIYSKVLSNLEGVPSKVGKNMKCLYELSFIILFSMPTLSCTVSGNAQNKVDQLFDSAKEGDIQRAQSLISEGVDVNSRNSNGVTALFFASSSGKVEMVKFLLHKGADIKIADKDGKTVLWSAVIGEDSSGRTVKALLEAGAIPNLTDNWGTTPLYWAADFGYFANVEALLKSGAEVNVSVGNGNTPLLIRISWGDLETTKLLLRYGAKVDYQRKDGWTPLMEAAMGGHTEIVNLLIENGASPNIRNEDGKTALELVEEFNQKNKDHGAYLNREKVIKILRLVTK